MTGPHDNSDTRPISVAELLARNGTIGAPPVGGRRRKRRGNADAVTVAELTGEIPVVRDDAPAVEQAPAPTNGTSETVAEPEPEVSQVDETVIAEDLVEADVPAEEMLPDPVDLEFDEDTDDQDAAIAVEEDRDELEETTEPPSYLDAVQEPLFGGRADDDDLVRDDLRSDESSDNDETAESVTVLPEVPPETTIAEDHEEAQPPTRLQQIGRGALVVLQSILAVAFGAGLFIAFDELWKWNNIVALVLSVLVILGLVVGVRVVRKTEDIASTLIAVAVGALVTLGPLALLQSG